MSGPVIANYRIERRLGSGTFATVWLAWDPDLERNVAIKVLADNWAANEDVRNRFIQEARILWRLDHPRIIRVFTTGTLDDGRPYFVMEYADAGSLLDRIRARKRQGTTFGIDEAVELSRNIADGLIVAHSRGVIHRDLKPSNILFSNVRVVGSQAAETTERLMLADFGMARQLERASRMTIAAGTPYYMAPEQSEPTAERGPSERSDVYAAATILYELLVGDVPYPFETISQILRAQERRERRPVRSVRPDVPEALAQVIDIGLEPDPANRYASAREWDEALAPFSPDEVDNVATQFRVRRDVSNGEGADEEPHEHDVNERPPSDATSPFSRFMQLSRSAQLAVGGVIVALLAVLIWNVIPRPNPLTPTSTPQPTSSPVATATLTLEPTPEPSITIAPTAAPTMSAFGVSQLTNMFRLMNSQSCEPGVLRTGTDAVYDCYDSGYQVTYTDYVSNISMLLDFTTESTGTSTSSNTWHYVGSPDVPEGDYVEFINQNGYPEIFWTIYGQHVSGRAIAPNGDTTGLENWWASVANVRP